jgi:hypothetical protein
VAGGAGTQAAQVSLLTDSRSLLTDSRSLLTDSRSLLIWSRSCLPSGRVRRRRRYLYYKHSRVSFDI